jgi:hypothetical protein
MFEKLRAQRRIKLILGNWVAIRDLVRRSAAGVEPARVDEERFLALKAEIARDVAWVETVAPGALRLDSVRQIRRINDALGHFRSLSAVSSASPAAMEAFEGAWHDAFLFLSKLQGLGLRPPDRGRTHHRGGTPLSVPRHRAPRPALGTWLIRFVLQAGVLVLILYLIARTVGVRREETGRWVFDPPTDVTDIGTNLWNGIGAVIGRSGQTLAPVVAQYGIEVTIFLVGVLLLTAGYWVFVRSR